MFRSSTPTQVLNIAAPGKPGLADRLISAQLVSTDAKGSFLIAALDLENVASELDDLALETQNELDRLVGILDAAIEDSDKNRRIAKRLREFVEDESDLTLF